MKAKKLISALLLVCMLASVMTVSAFADGVTKITLNVSSSGGASTVGADADITVKVGETFTITPSSEAADGADRTVTYSVVAGSDLISAVGTPDSSSGAQTYAASKAGSAKVVVTSNSTPDVHANCNVTIEAVTEVPAPTATPEATKITVVGPDTCRVDKSIELRADVTGGEFNYWEIDTAKSDGAGVISGFNGNRQINFTGSKAGKVILRAYAKDNTWVEKEITVTDRNLQVECTVSRIDNNEHAHFTVMNPIATGETFTWSISTSPAGVDIASLVSNYGTGIEVVGGKGDGTITVTATAADGATGSKTVQVNSLAYGDATISPNTVTWSRGQGNLTFTVEPNFYDAYIDGVCFTGSGNTDKYSHVWSSKNLVIKSSYLATLSAGQHTLRVDTVYDNGTSAGSVYATITISGTASAIYGDNAHVRGNSNNLIFTSTGGVKNVYISNQLIDPANYTLSADGKTLTLKANFLNLLNYGTYTMKLDTQSGGTETTSFRIVTANYAPATGDDSNLAIWVAVLLISGAGAVALIPRRKREM